MVKTRKMNGAVELLRMIFCLSILLYHISTDIFGNWRQISWGGIMRYAALGVEFFFITSGFYLEKSLVSWKNDNSGNTEIGINTWRFLCKKYKKIMPYHIIFNFIAFGIGLFRGHTILENINRLSCFFFLPVLGFNNEEWMLGSEWYIGYLFFAMLILLPFLFTVKQDITLRLIAPIGSIVLYGYLAANCDALMSGSRMIRTFAGVLLGITVYGLSEKAKLMMQKIKRKEIVVIIRLYPVIIIALFIFYLNSSVGTIAQPMMVLLLATGLVFTFAEEGFFSHHHIFDNQFVYWLGKISLPIYMIQNVTRMIVQTMFNSTQVWIVFLAELLITLLAGIAFYYMFELYKGKTARNSIKTYNT